MPAGLPKTVDASSADEDRPAKPVPIPLMLCSLSAKPLAKSWVDAMATARLMVVLSITFFIIRIPGDHRGGNYQDFRLGAIACNA
jgi:hypothetical protein